MQEREEHVALDYGSHTPVAPNEAVREVSALVDEVGQLEAEITKRTDELAEMTARHKQLSTQDIPEKLKKCGLVEMTTLQGYKVTLEKQLFANIPSVTAINKERDKVKRQRLIERRFECFKWLEEHGHDNVISREVIVKFGKDQEENSHSLAERLRGEEGYHVSESMDVHHSTLRSLLKQYREDSEPIPEELFGVYEPSVAKVSKK